MTERLDAHEAEARRGDARPLVQRLGWMALLWAGSVLVLGAIAFAIRRWLGLG